MTTAGHLAINNQFCEGQHWQLPSRDEKGDVRRTFSSQNEEALRGKKELPTKIAQHRGYLVRGGTRLL